VQALHAQLDHEIAAILNTEGFRTARGCCFSGNVVWLIRQRWQVPTVKENGKDYNPLRWREGTYSVAGAAKAVGVTLGTGYKWVRRGQIKGHQLTKGMPWKLSLTEDAITSLREDVNRVRRTKQSTMEAV
jgi:hypothetical protein